MRYIIKWSTLRLSESRIFTRRKDDGRSRRSDTWNNEGTGVRIDMASEW